MIASFHLVKYRRRRFGQKRLSEVDGLHFWRPFTTGPDFRELKAGFGSLALAKPNFRRWGFFGVWRDEQVLARFLETDAVSGDWVADAAEAWHLSMKPIQSAGTWQGKKPLGEFDGGDLPKAPVVALTRGDVRLSKVPAFWLSAAKIAVADVREAQGFVAGLAMTERPFLDVSTFTIWRSLDHAIEFSYRRQAHAQLLVRNRKERIMSAFFAAYFAPSQSLGTWNGDDPVAGVQLDDSNRESGLA